MSQHSEFVELAIQLIKENGRTIVLRKTVKSGPAYDPVTAHDDFPVKAVQDSFSRSDRENGLVTRSSRVYLIDAQTKVTKDMSIVDGKELAITHIHEERPGQTVIMYRVIADG